MLINEKSSSLLKNLQYIFSSQIISVISSVLISIIIPKLLSVEEFSYWQLFIFYVSYVGFFHLGFNDGVYLKYGGIEYKNINYSVIGTQFFLSSVIQMFVVVIIIIGVSLYVEDDNRKFIIWVSGFCLIAINSISFFSAIFQMSNRIKEYAYISVLNQFIVIVLICILLLCKVSSFRYLCIAYLVAHISTLSYCLIKAKEIVRFNKNGLRNSYANYKSNIKIGIKLMLSNISGMLILGISRIVIDEIWGITTFGTVSFALSLTYFFLFFIGQVSIVLFPTLRRIDSTELKKFYVVSRELISFILIGILLLYLPVKGFLELWLPQYAESSLYLGVLLPICIFDGKMQMICNTYLKVLRKERNMLYINGITVIVSSILTLICGYVLHNIFTVIIAMVIVVAMRSIIAEIYLNHILGLTFNKTVFIECIFSSVFIVSVYYFSIQSSFFIYGFMYFIYLFLKKNNILNTWQQIRRYTKI